MKNKHGVENLIEQILNESTSNETKSFKLINLAEVA